VLVWALASVGIVYLLGRTPMGRYIYAIGNSEAATFLSGINTRVVLVGCFALCGMLSALAGLQVAGYSSKAFQAMGDPYLMPSIAAVVIGGTNILGGQGKFSGTVVGTMLIVLLQSMLQVMDMPEAGRQVIYGLVIIAMLLVYRRGAVARG
jgi:ribose transport system permease protein